MLNKGQTAAYDSIMRWAKSSDSDMYSLSGYAGTGKTYLLSQLIPELQAIGSTVHCCAPTGKAASVLSSKLQGVEVTTAHSLLYVPVSKEIFYLESLIQRFKEDPTESLQEEIEEEKKKLTESEISFSVKGGITPDSIIVCDESSMVTSWMLQDFLNLNCKVLFVGDGGQLPPVGGKPWFAKRKHDSVLEEVVRQALESPIIRLSMAIREGHVSKSEWTYEDCKIVDRSKFPVDDWIEADQVLTGSNKSRSKLIRFFRKKLGFNELLPERGERMICIKNDKTYNPIRINGTMFESLGNCHAFNDSFEGIIDISYQGRELLQQAFYPYHCKSHYIEDLDDEPRELRRGLLEADYAYAITVHKSQGSEWDSVIVADDKMKSSDRNFRKQWLYTAATRAKKSLTIVQ